MEELVSLLFLLLYLMCHAEVFWCFVYYLLSHFVFEKDVNASFFRVWIPGKFRESAVLFPLHVARLTSH